MKIKIKKINNVDENEKTKTKIILDGIVDGDGLFFVIKISCCFFTIIKKINDKQRKQKKEAIGCQQYLIKSYKYVLIFIVFNNKIKCYKRSCKL